MRKQQAGQIGKALLKGGAAMPIDQASEDRLRSSLRQFISGENC
jgi:hypothetical protein